MWSKRGKILKENKLIKLWEGEGEKIRGQIGGGGREGRQKNVSQWKKNRGSKGGEKVEASN